jgi:hypothetical protein
MFGFSARPNELSGPFFQAGQTFEPQESRCLFADLQPRHEDGSGFTGVFCQAAPTTPGNLSIVCARRSRAGISPRGSRVSRGCGILASAKKKNYFIVARI